MPDAAMRQGLSVGLMGILDDYDSLYSHALGSDTGGNNGSPNHPGSTATARSTSACKARSFKLQSLVYKHVEDASIKNIILQECAAIAEAYDASATGARPHGAANGTSPAQHAINIMDRFCCNQYCERIRSVESAVG